MAPPDPFYGLYSAHEQETGGGLQKGSCDPQPAQTFCEGLLDIPHTIQRRHFAITRHGTWPRKIFFPLLSFTPLLGVFLILCAFLDE